MKDEKGTQLSIPHLRQILSEYFSEVELKNLAFDLAVDFENLPGHAKDDRIRELIAFLSRRGRVSELVEMGRQTRPNVPWDRLVTLEISHPSYSPQLPTHSRDIFHQYETALNNLLAQIGQDHPRYLDGLSYQNRLMENLNWVRRHGDSETRRSERSEIITALNDWALSTTGKSFNKSL